MNLNPAILGLLGVVVGALLTVATTVLKLMAETRQAQLARLAETVDKEIVQRNLEPLGNWLGTLAERARKPDHRSFKDVYDEFRVDHYLKDPSRAALNLDACFGRGLTSRLVEIDRSCSREEENQVPKKIMESLGVLQMEVAWYRQKQLMNPYAGAIRICWWRWWAKRKFDK